MSDSRPIEQLHHRGLADYHCHCDYSVDAVGTIDEYCRAAVQRGLAELCFTTHYDANPHSQRRDYFIRVDGEDRRSSPDNLSPYVDDVRSAAEKYLGYGLSVKLGVEIGWFPECEEMVAGLKERFGFDHVLCGIHEINDICFCCKGWYERCFAAFDVRGLAEAYFRQAVAAANSGLFDAIAHLDYYRKFGEGYYGAHILTAHEPFIGELFEALKANDTALEINTAALRKNLGDYFPRVPILNAARRAGVAVRFLGSDAHRPQDVGFDFDAAVVLLSDLTKTCEV